MSDDATRPKATGYCSHAEHHTERGIHAIYLGGERVIFICDQCHAGVMMQAYESIVKVAAKAIADARKGASGA